MKRLGAMLLSVMLMLSMSCMTFAHTRPTNAMMFRQIIETLSHSLKKEITSTKYSLNIIGGNDEKEFVRNEMMSRLTGIAWSSDAENTLTVTPTEMRTVYALTDQQEMLVRSCGMSATIRIDEQGQSRIVSIPLISLSDTIAMNEIHMVQQPGYTFCTAVMPQDGWNAFDSLVKPMLYVLTLGFSTWLLFSVRTQ